MNYFKLVEDFLCCGQPDGNSKVIGADGHFQKRSKCVPETLPVDAELCVMGHAFNRYDLLVAVGQAGKEIDHVGIGRNTVMVAPDD